MTLVARSLVFAVLFLWMAVGPFYRQVLEVHNDLTHYVREWSMFSARGIGFVEARYFQIMPDGSEQDLDRFELLGFPDPRKAPGWLWRIPHSGKARDIAIQLCAKLGPDADVRVISRRATTRGWKPRIAASQKWCGVTRSRDPRDRRRVRPQPPQNKSERRP